MKDSDLFRKIDDLETLTDEDLALIIQRITALITRVRKARGEADAPNPVPNPDNPPEVQGVS